MKYTSRSFTYIFRGMASIESSLNSIIRTSRLDNAEDWGMSFDCETAAYALNRVMHRGITEVYEFYTSAKPGQLGRIFASALNNVKTERTIDNYESFFKSRALA